MIWPLVLFVLLAVLVSLAKHSFQSGYQIGYFQARRDFDFDDCDEDFFDDFTLERLGRDALSRGMPRRKVRALLHQLTHGPRPKERTSR